VLDHADVGAPRYVAHGHLFQTGWRWPYLITSRLRGTPWRQARLSAQAQRTVAFELGTGMRRVHELRCPDEPIWRRDVIGELRATCAQRQRRRGMLPVHLVDQIDTYLAEPRATQRLVHGDLHADHISSPVHTCRASSIGAMPCVAIRTTTSPPSSSAPSTAPKRCCGPSSRATAGSPHQTSLVVR
jgi:hypothetical protein